MVLAHRGAPLLDRLMARCIPEPNSGCWLWEGSMAGRYGIAFLTGTKVVGAHRAMLIAHGVGISDGQVVMHKCDNTLCVNPEHLCVGTQAENLAAMVRKKRQRGRKLPSNAISAILGETEMPTWALALWYGVCQKTIRNIRAVGR